jgi:adenylate cyclase
MVKSNTTNTSWLNRMLEKLKHAKGIIVAIAGGGAVLSGLVGYYTTYQTVKTGASSSAVTAPALVNTGALSIVVLPFANQTGDAQKGYIADALTTSITADLSRIRDAFVVSTTTAFAYKDKPVTAQQVGKEVGARFALQGSVLASGDKVRITAQLADTQTGAQLWSETLDGELTNLFALQDQVTARVGNSIGREMVIIAARDSVKKTTTPEIADLLMRARALAWKPLTLETFQQTEDLLRQVIARDPDNSAALARLAVMLTSKATNFATVLKPGEKTKMFEEANQLVAKVEAIDPNNPLIYGPLSMVRLDRNDMEGAKRAAMRGLELNPKTPGTYNYLALIYLREANPQVAVEYLTKGVNLDPQNPPPVMLFTLGCSHFYLGNDVTAIEWLSKAIEKSPKFLPPRAALAAAYFRKGDTEKAKATAAELLRMSPEFKISSMAQRVIAPKLWETKLLPYAKQAGLPE